MRPLIVVFTLILIPVFALVLEWRFEQVQKPLLEDKCRVLLDRADLHAVSVTLDHFHVRLNGFGRNPDDRDKAAELILSIPGLKLMEGDNFMAVPSKLNGVFKDGGLKVTGWVDSEKTRQKVIEQVRSFRSELKVSGDDIRVNSHVVMGPEAQIDDLKTTVKVAEFLESIRPPSSLSIKSEGGFFRLSGYLPSADLRKQVIASVQASPWEWPVEASKLNYNRYATSTVFTKGNALPAFLRSFYDSPSPGEFSIDVRNGPRLKAYATANMQAQWHRLLLPLSGATRVNMELTLLPSLMHFPGYRPMSVVDPGSLARLRAVFGLQTIHFARGSARLMPSEEAKLGPMVFAINAAGPMVKYVVAGYEEPGGEPGGGSSGRLRTARAEAVRAALVHLGVSKEVLEPQGFDAVKSSSIISEEVRRESRRVELLVK